VSIEPSNPTTVDDLIAAVDCSDCMLRWFKDNVLQADIEGTTVSADLTTKGETWSLLATEVADDGTEGLPGEAEAVIVNSPPVLGELSISLSDEVYTNDILTASIDASDADGEALTLSYAWSVNGSAVDSTTDSLDGQVHFDKGQEVILTVSATDEEAEVQASSEAIVVLNSTPTAPVVAIQQDGDLLCKVTTESEDLDDDTITYTVSWEVDGVIWTGSTATTKELGDTIDSTDLTSNEEWTCLVTPHDGTIAGTTGEDSVTVVLVRWLGLSASSHHTCGVTDLGSVECWGSDDYGQSTPPSGSFKSVSAGYLHTCGVKTSGSVNCWGIDDGSTDDYGQVTATPSGSFKSVSAGGHHTCGVNSSGSAECWGDDTYNKSTPPSGP
jgi:hypothetical protein